MAVVMIFHMVAGISQVVATSLPVALDAFESFSLLDMGISHTHTKREGIDDLHLENKVSFVNYA